jgi:hypothetical protein
MLANTQDQRITDPEAEGLDLVIERTRQVLTGLPWLQNAYGRAFLLPRKYEDVIKDEPHVFKGVDRNQRGEYFNVMPNDSIASHCFFIGRGSGNAQQPQAGIFQDLWEKRVDLIFYLNLKQINPDKDYYFTEELVQDVVSILKDQLQIRIIREFHETVSEVYDQFNLERIKRDQLHYPFAGIRFELLINYQYRCSV